MGFKSLTLGLTLALLISAPLTTEASVYEEEVSMEFNRIDTQIGKTVDFVEMQNHYIVKRDLAFGCGREYVKPCFSKRGITLSIEEAQAVAFGAMQLENGKHTSTGDDVYAYKAKGVIYHEWELPGVYENKKFMQAMWSCKRKCMLSMMPTHQWLISISTTKIARESMPKPWRA